MSRTRWDTLCLGTNLHFTCQVLDQELRELSLPLEQLPVAPLLRDPPLLHHDDPVNLGQVADAVGDLGC